MYLGVALCFLIIGIIAEFSTPLPKPYITTNHCLSKEIYVVIVEVVVIVIAAIYLIYKLWNTDDAFYFKFELKFGFLICVPTALLWGLYMITDIFPSYFRSSWFVMLSIVCGFVTAIVLPVILSFHSPRYRRLKRSLSVTNSAFSTIEKDRMLECVLDRDAFEVFKARCQRAWCVENLLFYKAVVDFREQFHTRTHEERRAQAKAIYDLYIKPESNLEVNLDHPTREAVLELLDGPVSIVVGIFDEPMNTVSTMLRFGVFREWSLTDDFRQRFPEDYESRPSTANGHKGSMQSTVSATSDAPLRSPSQQDLEMKGL